MLETAIYTWVYEKNRLKQTQKFYEISINRQQAILNHLVYARTLMRELVVVCGLVATVHVFRTIGCRFGLTRKKFFFAFYLLYFLLFVNKLIMKSALIYRCTQASVACVA